MHEVFGLDRMVDETLAIYAEDRTHLALWSRHHLYGSRSDLEWSPPGNAFMLVAEMSWRSEVKGSP